MLRDAFKAFLVFEAEHMRQRVGVSDDDDRAAFLLPECFFDRQDEVFVCIKAVLHKNDAVVLFKVDQCKDPFFVVGV